MYLRKNRFRRKNGRERLKGDSNPGLSFDKCNYNLTTGLGQSIDYSWLTQWPLKKGELQIIM